MVGAHVDALSGERIPSRPTVLHVRNSDRYGGPERLIVEHAARARTTRPVVASFGRAGEPHVLLDAAKARGIETALVEQAGSYDPRIVARLRALATTTGAQVLVGHDYKCNLALAAANRRLRLPRASLVHGYTREDAKVAIFEAVDRRLLRHADAVVAVSDATRDAVVDAGVPTARVHVVENGIDVAATEAEAASGRAAVRREWRFDANEFAIVAVGRLSPEKGHATLLEAFGAVGDSRARLVLVGDGPSMADLRRAGATLAPGRVRFEGWRTDPVRCLGAADAFALPSLREGLPLALLEAMAAGVPIVASAVGGVPAALDGGACGILVPPGDVQALAGALRALVQEARRREAHATAARSRVRARYDVAAQAPTLEAVWASLVRPPLMR